MLVLCCSPSASAVPFSFELDAQYGYTGFTSIEFERVEGSQFDNAFIHDMVAGLRGSFGLTMLNLVLDYQYGLLKNTQFLHLGLGVDLKMPIESMEFFFRFTGGLLYLAIPEEAIGPAAVKDVHDLGLLGRMGGGIATSLGEWFHLGGAVDLGVHSSAGGMGFDWSVQMFAAFRLDPPKPRNNRRR